ncbi:TPA: NACHT domain-containing protein [Enterobacter soli]|uniref:NACHT domain-containing protein n=1 Tax=Enterobacter soli TaxID=885040 RepID=A0AAW8HD55_9ENTR|nr:NACHT domain-containing protein [Enterobacter soli]MDQ2258909.1 NACHT domain-containing protein [Enterobacter soli]MDQ2339416.1 NACHT domain-containing protein [Enterobacter soli]HEE9790079.1 NACHT domain-containing protein [Enterobacter soli]
MEPTSAMALSLGTAVVTKMAEKVGENTVDSVFSRFKKIASQKWKTGNTQGKDLLEALLVKETFYRYFDLSIKKYLSVRTLYNRESDSFIDEIYHPLAITNNRTREKLIVDDKFIIKNENVSNIIGIAGQGKTTILRKIFLCHLSEGVDSKKIPFFLDLRDLRECSVTETIIETLKDIGINSNNEQITSLYKSKKIILLLDGFDEILPQNRKKILDEILFINHRYQTQIVTTSRPDTEICLSSGVDNFRVLEINEIDVFNIINKLVEKETAPKLIEALKSNKRLLETITTPILAILLCVCEKHLDTMPKNAKEYYSRVFNILYEGHDKTKFFYKRHNESNLSINDARDVFLASCFYTVKDLNFLSKERLTQAITRGLKPKGLDGKKDIENNVLEDFINVTGLIRRDGAESYTFVHRTIQEYHAAEYIKSCSSKTKSKILNKLLTEIPNNRIMVNTAVFLNHIDNENTIEELIIPLMEQFGFNEEKIDYKKLANHVYNVTTEKAVIIIKEKKMTGKGKQDNFNFNETMHNVDVGPFNDKLSSITAFDETGKHDKIMLPNIVFDSFLESESCIRIISELDHVKKDGIINSKNSISVRELVDKTGRKDSIISLIERLLNDIHDNMYIYYKIKMSTIKNEKELYLDLEDFI